MCSQTGPVSSKYTRVVTVYKDCNVVNDKKNESSRDT